MRYCSTALVVLFVISSLCAQQPETFGSVKQRYLNQKVVIGGYVTDLGKGAVLLNWYLAGKTGGRFENLEYSMRNLPAPTKGRTQLSSRFSCTDHSRNGR
jgi:hypothetical protein